MKAVKFLDQHLEEIIMGLLIGVVTFNTCLQCFTRYVLKYALPWTDELSKYCFIYSGFFSIGYTIRKHSMIRVNIIESVIPRKAYAVITMAVDLFMTVFFSYLFYYSLGVFREFYSSKMISPALQIPMWVLYGCALIGFALAIIRSIQNVIISDIPACFGKAKQ